jgi:hypothetical protein
VSHRRAQGHPQARSILRACEVFKNQSRRSSQSEIDRVERARIDLFGVTKG